MTEKSPKSPPVVPARKHHHLSLDRSKGTWKIRLTLTRDAEKVGERVTIALGRCDEITALLLRDKVIEGFTKAGVPFASRLQKAKNP